MSKPIEDFRVDAAYAAVTESGFATWITRRQIQTALQAAHDAIEPTPEPPCEMCLETEIGHKRGGDKVMGYTHKRKTDFTLQRPKARSPEPKIYYRDVDAFYGYGTLNTRKGKDRRRRCDGTRADGAFGTGRTSYRDRRDGFKTPYGQWRDHGHPTDGA